MWISAGLCCWWFQSSSLHSTHWPVRVASSKVGLNSGTWSSCCWEVLVGMVAKGWSWVHQFHKTPLTAGRGFCFFKIFWTGYQTIKNLHTWMFKMLASSCWSYCTCKVIRYCSFVARLILVLSLHMQNFWRANLKSFWGAGMCWIRKRDKKINGVHHASFNL